MAEDSRIEQLRVQIDEVDREIVERLNRRAKLALEIGEVKKGTGKAVFDPAREKRVTARVLATSDGPFPPRTLAFIYREIIGACRSLEEPTRVAYLGPEATFTHAAALKKFGTSAVYLPQSDMADIFREVDRGNAAYGVVPVENSIEGAVTSTLDLFPDSDVLIVGEIYLEVVQNLLTREGALDEIDVVYSHPHALAQCRGWLRKNMPHARVETVSSTGEAARLVAEHSRSAAIGSIGAAELYGLHVLARSIEDNAVNVTRFIVISREPLPVTEAPKTSILLGLKDEPGILFKILQPLAEAGVNMSKIESRPLKRRPWEYRFFIDIEGDPAREPLSSALAQMEPAATEMRILGTYEKVQRPAQGEAAAGKGAPIG